MAFLKENRGFILGFSMGLGAGFIARELVPTITNMIKPTTKMLIHNGMAFMEKFREIMAKAGETIEDLTAEVNLELQEERNKKPKKATRTKKTILPKSPPL